MPSYNAMSDNIYNYDENGEPYTDNYQDGCYQVRYSWLLSNKKKWAETERDILSWLIFEQFLSLDLLIRLSVSISRVFCLNFACYVAETQTEKHKEIAHKFIWHY